MIMLHNIKKIFSNVMSLWSPCGLYANLPYGYASTSYINPTSIDPTYKGASTNFINPTSAGVSVDFDSLSDNDAMGNLNDLTIQSSLANQTTLNLTTKSPNNDFISTIDGNSSIEDGINANNSLSKR